MSPRKNNNNNKPKYIRHLGKGDKMPKLKPRLFDLVNKMMKKSDFRYHPIHDQHKQFHPYHLDEDMSSFNPQFRKASSVEGLIVILNPNLPEYKTGAVKNNFFGFKYLVQSLVFEYFPHNDMTSLFNPQCPK